MKTAAQSACTPPSGQQKHFCVRRRRVGRSVRDRGTVAANAAVTTVPPNNTAVTAKADRASQRGRVRHRRAEGRAIAHRRRADRSRGGDRRRVGRSRARVGRRGRVARHGGRVGRGRRVARHGRRDGRRASERRGGRSGVARHRGGVGPEEPNEFSATMISKISGNVAEDLANVLQIWIQFCIV